MKYRPEIDGLRAVAVISVIFFHAGFSFFGGGYVGVDVFFVISGYLITTIVLTDLLTNKFSLINFYERRVRRILPALASVCLFSTFLAWMLMNPVELRKFGNGLIGVATFTSNIVFWKSEGYFDEATETNPLLHTWSLAVEEQWYILFPILILAFWKLNKKLMIGLILILTIISFFLSELGWRNNPSANFYLMPYRAWELLVGSVAAFILHKYGVRQSNLLSIIGAGMLSSSVVLFNKSTPFPSIFTLLPVVGVILIIFFCTPSTFVFRILSNQILVIGGLISYSAYLLHQPLFAFFRIYTKSIHLTVGVSLFLIIISFCLAYLSWKYIENPVRERLVLRTRKSLFAVSSISLILLCAMGVASKVVSDDHEITLAKKLSNAEFVYFSNLDERRFVEARLFYPLKETKAVIMGSSRIMQVNSNLVGLPSLNLSVSGASIEDYVALVGESVARLKPSKVFLGADPWLFNQFDEQERWQSLANLFTKWNKLIESKTPLANISVVDMTRYNEKDPAILKNFYELVNLRGSVIAQNELREATAKKAYDGSHIYDEKNATLDSNSIAKGFGELLNYSMKYFAYDSMAYDRYASLIHWLRSNGITVYIVLSPYHPKLYELMRVEKQIFLEMEKKFRDLANDLDVKVLGSYDPTVVGCEPDDFYDGMHPKEVCMAKVFQNRSPQN